MGEIKILKKHNTKHHLGESFLVTVHIHSKTSNFTFLGYPSTNGIKYGTHCSCGHLAGTIP